MLQMRRPRRLRVNDAMRQLIQENKFSLSSIIQPIFVEEGISKPILIPSMPGILRIPEGDIEKEIKELAQLGILAVMPFGVSKHKDSCGSDTWDAQGLVARMIKAIKKACPNMVVIPDICFCEYTDHGHCGVFKDGVVDNDKTVENLVKQAIVAAKSGADMLAPSAMMDGQVGAIRRGLDEAGFTHVGILAHAAKFSSAFYGPFRSAVDTTLKGDRKTYQADPSNGQQSLIEATLDEEEGADILMVKPGMPYLDIVRMLKMQTNLPLAVYQVSGEYAMLKQASLSGALDEKKAVLETMLAFKRAGASVIVSYYGKQLAKWLKAESS